MKILMTLMGLEIGGAETHVVELSKELVKQGHTVLVASNGGVYESALAECGIRHFKIPMHKRSTEAMYHSLGLLRELISREKPDLVHAHARIPAFLCGILHKQMHFPFITSAHGVFQVTPVLRLMTNWGERTVAVSEDIKDYLMLHYQLPRDQIHITINGIDTANFMPMPPDRQLAAQLGLGSGPVIATIGRLDSPQEITAESLIRMMPQLLQISPNLQLLVVGGGDQEERLSLQADKVNQEAGRKAVVMTGPRVDIPNLLSLCDLFVGVSRAALEAMAMEKPTILAGGQGYIGLFSSEVLSSAQQSNFCCRGFAPIDPGTLFHEVVRLLRMDAAQKRMLGRYGRRIVLEQYSVSRMTNDYLDAYEKLLHPPHVIRAAISGYYGYGNLGDDAILLSISKQLSDPEHPVRLTVLSRNPEETKRQYGLSAVHRFSPWGVYRTLRKADVLISGGGSLLQDKTSTRSLMYYLSVIRMAKHLQKPVFLYANGIGPINRDNNRSMVRECLEMCDVITLRDSDSLKEIQRLGVKRDDILVTGDPAFILRDMPTDRTQLNSFGVPEDARLVGVSVRNIPHADHFIGEFARLCDRLTRDMGKTIVFLVMQESEDEAISQQIQQLMQEKSYLVKAPGDPPAMLSMIGQMDTVVAMRLHTIIFAANMGIPTVGCVYDPKVHAVLKMLQLPSCGTPSDIDADQAYTTTAELLNHSYEYRQRMKANITKLNPRTDLTVQAFRRMLKDHLMLED